MLEGQQTRREQSPFEELLEKAANTPIIWETIMSNVSGADVANCLKVSKGLRHLIKQCMQENSIFCQQMHVAAAASALGKGWIRSKIRSEERRGGEGWWGSVRSRSSAEARAKTTKGR